MVVKDFLLKMIAFSSLFFLLFYGAHIFLRRSYLSKKNCEKEQKMTIDEARAIARAVCEKQGWPFFDPVRIYSYQEVLVVTTNYGSRGCNASITVSKATGEVIEVAYAPR